MKLHFLHTLHFALIILLKESICSIYTTNEDVQTFEIYDYFESMTTARIFIDLNNEVKFDGVMFAVTAYLMTTGSVDLAVWRQINANAFELKFKYSLPVDRSMLFKRQEFYLPADSCFRVYPGYKVGIILPANNAPVGFRFRTNNATALQAKTSEGLEIGSIEVMDNLKLPYIFAISALYDTKLNGIDPNNASITMMGCPKGAKILPDNSVLTKCNTSARILLEECPVNITNIPGPMGPPGLQGPPGPPSPAALSTDTLAANPNIIGILIWLSLLSLIQFVVIVYLLLQRKRHNYSASTTPLTASTIDQEPGLRPGGDIYPNFRIAPAYNNHHSWVGKMPEDNWTLYKVNDNSSASCISAESC